MILYGNKIPLQAGHGRASRRVLERGRLECYLTAETGPFITVQSNLINIVNRGYATLKGVNFYVVRHFATLQNVTQRYKMLYTQCCKTFHYVVKRYITL